MDRKAYHMILKRRGYDVISQMYSCKYLVLSFSNALFTILDSNVMLRNPCLRFHVLPRINIRTMILGSSSFLEQVKPHFLPPLFPWRYISTLFASRSTSARFLDALGEVIVHGKNPRILLHRYSTLKTESLALGGLEANVISRWKVARQLATTNETTTKRFDQVADKLNVEEGETELGRSRS